MAMSLRNQVPDKTILKNVNQKIARKGLGGQSKIMATVRNGDVTITGTLAYAHELRSIINAINSVPGIGRVINQLVVETKKKTWD